MEKTPESDGFLLTLKAQEVGNIAGACFYPTGGFTWSEGAAEDEEDGLFDPGPWLITRNKGALLRPYAVMRKNLLARNFESLAERPTEKNIKLFADRYGYLDYTRLRIVYFNRGDLPDGAWTESLELWQDELRAFLDLRRTWRALTTLRQADLHPISQVQQARKRLKERFTWNIYQVLYRRKDESDEMLLEAYREYREAGSRDDAPAQKAAGVRWQRRVEQAGQRGSWRSDEQKVLSRVARGGLAEAARIYVHDEINWRLRGRVNLVLQETADSVLRLHPDSLLTAIYLHFAREVAGAAATERPCDRCQLPFAQHRRDQRFCSKNCREAAGYHRRRGSNHP